MKLIRSLLNRINEKEDLSNLPEDSMKEIQKNIRDGAKDLTQEWSGALELVHKAYEVSGIQRPTPDMEAAWKQYEENLEYAVDQLSDTRGLDGKWRMTLPEEIDENTYMPMSTYMVTHSSSLDHDVELVEARSVTDIVTLLKENARPGTKFHISKNSQGDTLISYSVWGVTQKYNTKIEKT